MGHAASLHGARSERVKSAWQQSADARGRDAALARDALAIHGGAPAAHAALGRAGRSTASRSAPRWLRVLESGTWGGFPQPQHARPRAFAREFARYVGAGHAVPCANGTFSLTLALQAARVPPGAEVITSAYTFVGTAGGILAAGCVPVFVGRRPRLLLPRPARGRGGAHRRAPRRVMPVHLACSHGRHGRARARSARGAACCVVEDCAHAHGARWRGRGAGTLGTSARSRCSSSKLLTAGEGGAVTHPDATYARAALVARELRAQGAGLRRVPPSRCSATTCA